MLYNCRLSALTNLAAAGVPETVARSISGHRTASVQARYQISAEETKRAALERLGRATGDALGRHTGSQWHSPTRVSG